ncbi:thiamine phosphate synthase [Caldichromatium japonicum]|uniref:Thiamine-phosphate synthase n=1 Tax=Caldichromatium japonicum TaxID=2699430 RepID=A0A6G7VFK4_9GAMM|nr:thiamine phosphate synthase [Caldichromatium japonicum]QIK38628.1 thiamine phosphate synthase [Caldichromatium japonicum]
MNHTPYTPQLRGLYAITPDPPPEPERLTEQVALAIQGGARLIQYRDKHSGSERRRRYIERLLAVCRAADVPLLINDDLELAAELAADGVHLGRGDPGPLLARRLLGEEAIIGVSCYDQLARAEWAQDAGASYVAFGSFFPSSTKPNAVRPDLCLLTQARLRLRLPLVAIGGITPHNGGSLISAGADLLAVVSGLFSQPDIAAAARAYADLFDN